MGNLKRFSLQLLCVLFCTTVSVFAQNHVKILDYDISSFPEIKTTVLAFKANQIQNSLRSSDLLIMDNGKNSSIKSVKYGAADIEEEMSVVIAFDQALNSLNTGKSNFEYGKELVQSIINHLDYSKVECAVTSYDMFSYLNQDFSKNKQRLLNSLTTLHTARGAFFDAAITSQPAGGLPIAKYGKHKKVVILITDGSSTLKKDEIIKAAKDEDVKLFCISIGKSIPNSLKEVVRESKGMVLDNIDVNEDANMIANAIISYAIGYQPCEITWNANISCEDNHEVKLSVPVLSAEGKFSYNINLVNKLTLVSSPTSLGFSQVKPKTKVRKSITITAENGDIAIDNITIDKSTLQFKDDFEIVSGAIPPKQTLKKGASHTFVIEFAPKDSAIVFTSINITSNACIGNTIYVTGGFPNTPPKLKNIKLTAPECDDYLIVGETYPVEWIGLLPEDVIQLEYSVNKGVKWDTLQTNVQGLKYDWKVPDKVSSQCLIRAIQLWPNNIGRTLKLKHKDAVNSGFFNKDGDKVITASSNNIATLWNSNNGYKVREFKGHTGSVKFASFSPDQKLVATASEDSTAKIWNVDTGAEIITLTGHSNKVNSIAFSPDNKKVVTTSFDGKAKIWDVKTGAVDLTINAYVATGRAWYAEFDPSGFYIITAGNDGIAKLWNANGGLAGKIFKTFDTRMAGHKYGNVVHTTFNADASKLSAVEAYERKVYVWDLKKDPSKKSYLLKDTIYSIFHNSKTKTKSKTKPLSNKVEDNLNNIHSAYFGRDSKSIEYILTSGINEAGRWFAKDGAFIDYMRGEHTNSIKTTVMNFDGSRILTSCWDSTAKIWNLDQRDLQMDTTDCPFSIVKPILDMKAITFNNIVFNTLVDTLVKEFIVNPGQFDIEIRELKIYGGNETDFTITSEYTLPFTLKKGEVFPIEIMCFPKGQGRRIAEIEIKISGNKTVTSRLEANVITPGIKPSFDMLDYRKVDMGEFKDSIVTVIIENVSSSPIKLDSIKILGSSPGNFNMLEGSNLETIAANSSKKMVLRYTPNEIIRNNAQLYFWHKGKESKTKINLFGEGVIPVVNTATVYMKDFKGKPGEVVDVPIYIKNINEEGIKESITGILSTIKFNATLLEPMGDFESNVIDKYRRTIKIALPVKFGKDSILKTIKFKVGLGNDTVSTVDICNSHPIGLGKITIAEEDAKFNLTGYSVEGGLRLYDPYGNMDLLPNEPNPASTTTEIKYSVSEKGRIQLYLVDMLGKRIKTIINSEHVQGNYSVDLDVSNLSSGVYRYVLQTPSRVISRSLEVKK